MRRGHRKPSLLVIIIVVLALALIVSLPSLLDWILPTPELRGPVG